MHTLLPAVVICTTISPARDRLVALCRGRSSLTAALMCLTMVLLLVIPLAILSGSLANGVETAVATVRPPLEQGLPTDAPRWLIDLPFLGGFIDDYWHKLVASREEMNEPRDQFIARAARRPGHRFAFRPGVLLLLVVFFVFFILRDADTYADALRTGSRRTRGRPSASACSSSPTAPSPASWSASSALPPPNRWSLCSAS